MARKPGKGRDFADVAQEDGGEAVRAAIGGAGPKVKLPFGFKVKADGIYFDDGGEAGPMRICGPLDVLAETRDDRGSNWGLLLAWRDNDGRDHRWAMPRSMLAGDGVEIRAALLDQGLTIAAGRKARERLSDFLAGVRADATAWAVDRLGWQDGCFALPDRTIGETGGKRVIFQNSNAHDHAYHEAGSYGTAGPAFVAGVIGKGIDATSRFVAKGIDAFASEHLPENAGGQAWRAARRFGMVAAAGELAREFGVLPWPEGEASRAAAVLFRQWLSGRGGAGASEDAAAIAQVRAFLELHGSSRFEMIKEAIDGQEVLGDGHRAVINRAGFFRMDHAVEQRVFYVMPEAWKEICAGIDPKRTARLLGDRGMLRRDSAGGNTCPVNIPTIGKMRLYVVMPSIFTEQAE